MYGKGSVTSDTYNQHKRMAGADSKGNFGVKALPQRSATHPDANMRHDAMDEGKRGAPPGLSGKGKMAMQAAPDHGPQYDHYKRDGKA